MNITNLAQTTNFICGSEKLNLCDVFLQQVNLPGISFGHPETGGRLGAKLHVQADSCTFNTLSLSMIIDEKFKLYKELMETFSKTYNPENGTFSIQEFDFWIELRNNKGNKLFKIDFVNAKFESIDDVQLDVTNEEVYNTLSCSIVYDYFKIS